MSKSSLQNMWITYRQQLELLGEHEHTEQFQSQHGQPQVLVICHHQVVGHILLRALT